MCLCVGSVILITKFCLKDSQLPFYQTLNAMNSLIFYDISLILVLCLPHVKITVFYDESHGLKN